jgi:uncharacterized protein YcgI (DUF1989 family)
MQTEQIIIPAREYTAFEVHSGQILRVISLEGRQCADVIAFNLDNLEERLHNARAMRLNSTYKPTVGHLLYSDDCNPMFKITADTLNENFLGDSMCSEEMNFARYGVRGTRNCRDNLAMAVQPWGISKRQLPGAFAPFMSVSFAPNGETHITDNKARPGDYIDLQAQMNLLVAISNCPQNLNPVNGFKPTAIAYSVREA